MVNSLGRGFEEFARKRSEGYPSNIQGVFVGGFLCKASNKQPLDVAGVC